MRPEAPIIINTPKVDPFTKEMRSRPYAEFSLQVLGIDCIEGYDVRDTPDIRLSDAEPGSIYSLCVVAIGESCGAVRKFRSYLTEYASRDYHRVADSSAHRVTALDQRWRLWDIAFLN